MRASPELSRALICLVALGLSFGCANKQHASDQASGSAAPALPDLPEPAGVVAELRLAHPDATYRAFRELGSPLSALLPAGYPVLATSVLGLPPLTADSFDADLPAVGVLVQAGVGEPGWLVALHAVSGAELIAKLSTGDHAPFRAVTSNMVGLKMLEPSVVSTVKPSYSLAVFDNYLLLASSAELLGSVGPYAARMLPRHPPAQGPLALRFSKRALSSSVVPALRALWAGYRTRLAHSDQTDRSVHGGRAPDFADPAQVILGADTLVESLLSLVDDAAALELDLDPQPNRLDVALVLEPEAGSDVQAKLAALAGSNAQPLLSLPAETGFALGLSRSAEEREVAGKAAGDDWVRLLGARLTEHDAQQLRAALADWELGRGTSTSYGFLAGGAPGAFLVTRVGDAARLKRAAPGLLGLLGLPGLRAPLVEFLGQPHVSDGVVAPGALPDALRKKVVFTPAPGHKASLPGLSFAWLVEEAAGFAAVGADADAVLKAVVQSAHGEHDSLASKPGIADSVSRVGDQAALFAYADGRLLFPLTGASAGAPAPLVLSIGKRANGAALRLEISRPAIDLAIHQTLGQ